MLIVKTQNNIVIFVVKMKLVLNSKMKETHVLPNVNHQVVKNQVIGFGFLKPMPLKIDIYTINYSIFK